MSFALLLLMGEVEKKKKEKKKKSRPCFGSTKILRVTDITAGPTLTVKV